MANKENPTGGLPPEVIQSLQIQGVVGFFERSAGSRDNTKVPVVENPQKVKFKIPVSTPNLRRRPSRLQRRRGKLLKVKRPCFGKMNFFICFRSGLLFLV